MTPASLVLALLAAAPPRPPPAPLPGTARLADGLEIVVLPLEGASSASMRMVVRAGGAADPPGRAGLAHLVEHLALEGSYDEAGQAFLDDARRAGALVNAHTYPSRTQYELDAPAAAFGALAERLVKIVTSPAWERAPVESERRVIETEAGYHESEGLLSLVDRAVFPAPLQAGPLAGTAESRSALALDDAVRFFASRYAPSSVTFVFAGAVRLEEARALVERAFRIPPALPSEASPPAGEPPSLPLQQKITGGLTATMLGYALDPRDRGACEAVAALVELRLSQDLQVEGPLLPGVFVLCPVLRGNPLILAAVYTSTFDAGDLPAALDAAFAAVGRTPPTAAERAVVDARLDREQRRMLSRPAALAERAAALVADAGDPRPLAVRLARSPLPDAPALARLARRSFAREHRVLVHVSPLQQ